MLSTKSAWRIVVVMESAGARKGRQCAILARAGNVARSRRIEWAGRLMQTDPTPARAALSAATPDPELARARRRAATRPAFEAIMRRHNQLLFRTARSILQERRRDRRRAAGGLPARLAGDRRLSRRREALDLAGADRHQRSARPPAPAQRPDHSAGHRRGADRSRDAPGVGGRSRPPPRARRDARRDAPPDRGPHRPAAEAFRTVFMLRAVEEMSVEEVAAALEHARGDGAHPLLPRPRPAARRPVARGRRRRSATRSRSTASAATGSSPACSTPSLPRTGDASRS